jgi:hypothetical protein
MQRIGIIALLYFSAATAAHAQEPRQFYLLVGGQFGPPTRTTADLGIIFAAKDKSPEARFGFLAEGGLGQGGARYSAGVWAIEKADEGIGMDVRVVMNHTFASPHAAAPGSKYVGFEAGMTFAYIFRISAGVERRVGGPSGPHGTIYTVSGGVQVPVPLFRIR